MLSWTQNRCLEALLGYCDNNVWNKLKDNVTDIWSTPGKITRFRGDDGQSAVAGLMAGRFAFVFESDRRQFNPYFQAPTVWFGDIDLHADLSSPPAVVRQEHFPIVNPQVGDEVRVRARVAGDLMVDTTTASTTLHWSRDGVPQPEIDLVDRGGGLFGASLGVFQRAGVVVRYRVHVIDANGVTMFSRNREFEVQPRVVKRSNVLLVVDDTSDEQVRQTGRFYGEALRAAGVPFDGWNTSRLGPPLERHLMPYRDGVVIWAVPRYEPWLWHHPIPNRVTNAITAYLDRDGSLFISGQNIAEHFRGGWVARYLRVRFVDCCGPQEVVGEPGDIIGDGLAFGLKGGDGAHNSSDPDVVEPLPGARVVFNYGTTTTSTQGVAAVRSRRGQSRVVYFGFNFESINASTTRDEVMTRVMNWTNPTCNGRASTIDGTRFGDVLIGTPHDDVIVTYGGYDRVWGLGGNDTICGGPVIDVLVGGDGNDWIHGFGGRDMISAGQGRDEVYGGGFDDMILGGPGDDAIDGGGGNDQVWAGPGADFVFGGGGADVLFGNEGDDIIDGGPGVGRGPLSLACACCV